MKIGILTYFWAQNPGTYLQAYSTYRIVKEYYPKDDVEIINVRSRRVYFRPTKRSLLSLEILLKLLKRFYSYKKGIQLMNLSKGGVIGLDPRPALEYINKQNYDIIFVGSDTIYQLNSWYTEHDILSVYFLEGINSKKIMLAASSGSTSLENFSQNMKKAAKICLNDFAKLGIRDKNTFDLFSELKGNKKNMEIISDPTYTYPINIGIAKDVLLKNNFDFNAKSVILNLPKNFKFLGETIEFFKKLGWKIVTFNYTNYADYCLFVNPEEWAGIPYYVDLVITDRFHGSLFALRNNTPVIGIDCNPKRVTVNNSSKIKRLFEDYEILNNYINTLNGISCADYLQIISYTINTEFDFSNKNDEMEKKYRNFIKSI